MRGLFASRHPGRAPGTFSGQGVQEQERQAALVAALADLPDDQRAIVVLRDVQGLDYDQIAECLQIAVGTVKSRLFRARLALRELTEARLGTGGQTK